MVKRKGSSSDDVAKNVTKKVKKVSDVNEQKESKLNYTSCESVMSSLLQPISVKTFFEEFWEKKPLYIKRENSGYYGDLFSLSSMKEILAAHELEFETDVNVCRYVDNEKELLNEDGCLTVDKFDKLMNDKHATFQLHQPQRYGTVLWQLMEKMETYFGCLVGSNVYITPKESQGLAPHCDDVEVFILQLEGTKHWKLYKPMVELSRDYTQDLSQDSIGKPIMELTLEPGDLLYFPRGTIHQARSVGESYSTHITLSTYQNNTLGDFMSIAVSQAIESALENDVSFRRGLPINYLSYLGTAKNFSKYFDEDGKESKLSSNENNEKVKKFKDSVKKHLSKLIDHIDVNTAADMMSYDFMASRLPPFGHVVKEEQLNEFKSPTLDSKIKLRYPEHVRPVYYDQEETDEADNTVGDDDSEDEEEETVKKDEDEKNEEKDEKSPKSNKKSSDKKDTSMEGNEDEEDEDDDDASVHDDEPCIKIVHSLNNNRETHMSGHDLSRDVFSLKLPIHFAQAITSVMNSNDFICVRDLPLDDDEDKLQLATSLYSDDLIEIK
ncbi:ribosomal oxygenase 2 isoform X1 [Hydra vulgaris]|uniref:ribosomal oxygenase 2 isoform X1 n=1 Tax=Hydra vulgaris TaxID=6087 RepID=UPI001F5FEFEB|nr:ribosomal oxygenase 2 [Hydra vulgaris]